MNDVAQVGSLSITQISSYVKGIGKGEGFRVNTYHTSRIAQEMLSTGQLTPDEVGQMSCQAYVLTEEGIRDVLEEVSDLWSIKAAFLQAHKFYEDASAPGSSPLTRRQHKEAAFLVGLSA